MLIYHNLCKLFCFKQRKRNSCNKLVHFALHFLNWALHTTSFKNRNSYIFSLYGICTHARIISQLIKYCLTLYNYNSLTYQTPTADRYTLCICKNTHTHSQSLSRLRDVCYITKNNDCSRPFSLSGLLLTSYSSAHMW